MGNIDYESIHSEMRKQQEELQPIFDSMAESSEKAYDALLDIPEQLRAMNKRMDDESRASQKRDRITLLVAVLTLIATIVIGVISLSLQWRQMQQVSEPQAPLTSSEESHSDPAG